MGHSIQTAQKERRQKQKELNTLAVRDKELDNLFEHIYEDNVSGKISDDRFAKLSAKYETEQKRKLRPYERIAGEIDSDKSTTIDIFMASVRNYTWARKQTPRMLNELMKKLKYINLKSLTAKQFNGSPSIIIA